MNTEQIIEILVDQQYTVAALVPDQLDLIAEISVVPASSIAYLEGLKNTTESARDISVIAANDSQASAEKSGQGAEASDISAGESFQSASESSTSATESQQHATDSRNHREASESAAEQSQIERQKSEEAATASSASQSASLSSEQAAADSEIASETARTGSETAESGAVAAETVATEAQGLAESARDSSQRAQVASETAQQVSEAAQAQSEQAQAKSETARDSSIEAKDNSEASAAASEVSRQAAVVAQGKSETAQKASETAQSASETARNGSELAQQKSETAQAESELSASASEASRQASEAAQVQSESSSSASQSAQAQSEAAQAQSEAAQRASEQARDTSAQKASDSSASATESETSNQESNAAQVKSEEAQAKSEAAKTASENAKTASITAQNAAELAESEAKVSEIASASSASSASVSKSAAAGSASDSQSSRVASETARDKSQKWADNPYNAPVETSKYSARHWSDQARQYTETMTNGMYFAGSWVMSNGLPPEPTDHRVPWYRIVSSLDVESIAYSTATPGDQLCWDPQNLEWFIIDTTDQVAAVNGQVGMVDLDSDDVDARSDTWVPSWSQVTGKPSSYTPLTHSHPWSQVTGAPATATRWPQWSEITGSPDEFPPADHTHTWAQVSGKPAQSTRWPSWGEVTGKPLTFAPASHTHPYLPLVNPSATGTFSLDNVAEDSNGMLIKCNSGGGNIWESTDLEINSFTPTILLSDRSGNANDGLISCVSGALKYEVVTGDVRNDGRNLANGFNVWHSGNDGSGSGLDADKLDGIQSSQFLRSDQSGTISGSLRTAKPANITDWNAPFENFFVESSSGANSPKDIDGWFWGITTGHTSNRADYQYGMQIVSENNTPNRLFYRSRGVTGNGTWRQVYSDDYHPDTDTLGGVAASGYLRSNAADTVSANTTWSSGYEVKVGDGIGRIGRNNSGWVYFGNNTGGQYFRAYDDGRFEFSRGLTKILTDGSVSLDGGGHIYLNNERGVWIKDNTGAGKQVLKVGSGNGCRLGNDGLIAYIDSASNPFVSIGSSDFTLWHGGNDGSGSGLDADKVDGLQASQFIRSDADDNITGNLEFQDNKQLRFGNDADFRIWHDGTNTKFCNYKPGTTTYFDGVNESGTNRTMIMYDPDGGSLLMYAGVTRLRTDADGTKTICSDHTYHRIETTGKDKHAILDLVTSHRDNSKNYRITNTVTQLTIRDGSTTIAAIDGSGIDFKSKYLISSYGSSTNVDYITHDDGTKYGCTGRWKFNSDSPMNKGIDDIGNSLLSAGGIEMSSQMHLKGDGYCARVVNDNGYIKFGANNTSYAHFYTDRAQFYFDKNLRVKGEIYAGSGYNQKVYHSGNAGGLGVPIGGCIFWATPTPPSGFVEAKGQSTSGYSSEIIAIYGSKFPDMRGEFARGWDNGRGVDSGRALKGSQGESYKSHSHSASFSGASHSHTRGSMNITGSASVTNTGWYGATLRDGTGAFSVTSGGSGSNSYDGSGGGSMALFLLDASASWTGSTSSVKVGGSVSVGSSGSGETRPRSIAWMYIIRVS